MIDTDDFEYADLSKRNSNSNNFSNSEIETDSWWWNFECRKDLMWNRDYIFVFK